MRADPEITWRLKAEDGTELLVEGGLLEVELIGGDPRKLMRRITIDPSTATRLLAFLFCWWAVFTLFGVRTAMAKAQIRRAVQRRDQRR